MLYGFLRFFAAYLSIFDDSVPFTPLRFLISHSFLSLLLPPSSSFPSSFPLSPSLLPSLPLSPSHPRLDFHNHPPFYNHLPPNDPQNTLALGYIGTYPEAFRTFSQGYLVNKMKTTIDLLDVRSRLYLHSALI